MTSPLISVSIRTAPDADPIVIQRVVAGDRGRVCVAHDPTRFRATTPMTLKQVQALDGVVECRLAPETW